MARVSVFLAVKWERYIGIENVSYLKALAIVFARSPESIPDTMGSALAAIMNKLCFSGIWMSLTRWVKRPCRLWCLSLPLNTSHESLECWNRTMDTPFLLVSTVVLISPIVSLTSLLSFRSVLHHPFPFPFHHVSPQSWGSLARGPSKPRLAVCRAKEVLSFLSYFKTLILAQPWESNPRSPLCSQKLYRLS